MVTAADIAQYDTEELERQFGETRALFNLRFQLATGQLDNFSRINHVRKDVARMMTELRTARSPRPRAWRSRSCRPTRRGPPTHGGRGSRPEQDHRVRATGRGPGAKRTGHDDDDDDVEDGVDEDELAEEVADDDGMARHRRCGAGRRRRGPGRSRGEELMADETPAGTEERINRRKVREGLVVSDSMDATVVVAVVERVRHPRYGKTVQRTKRLYVHDGDNAAKVGDRVRVVETRPLSKLKRWRLSEVLERAR